LLYLLITFICPDAQNFDLNFTETVLNAHKLLMNLKSRVITLTFLSPILVKFCPESWKRADVPQVLPTVDKDVDEAVCKIKLRNPNIFNKIPLSHIHHELAKW